MVKNLFCDLSHVNSFVTIVSHYVMKLITNIVLLHHFVDFSCKGKIVWNQGNLGIGRG